jgi:hypothetical protein
LTRAAAGATISVVATIGRQVSWGTIARRVVGLARRTAARGLDVRVEPGEVRRGQAIGVTATVADAMDAELEVGLLCTETYASWQPTERLGQSDRAMRDELAYERWEPARPGELVELVVPSDAPYSYDGEHLKFRWEVAARRETRGLEPMRTLEVRVQP